MSWRPETARYTRSSHVTERFHLSRDAKAGILLNENIAENGPAAFARACRLGAEGIVSKKVGRRLADV